ncbi:ABC transporter ATP-binding protein [Hydrogenophaga laconesensis]|uniref:Molybdate transport system ATP-binding protein n=1 Tax=Hydrogenophaga laconesensis TaxID=1805971 RepID=A0ABU1VBQ0_9BURK|nr:ATP-binding cassette domain-containing protein [Hydrogenophaga laconesensis]MDR7094894.1 molybdate transport system ATP-binding protein [Hydrogenophaga laconesensis]
MSTAPLPPAHPVWDVSLRKTLRQGQSSFLVDVAFRSQARRVVLFGPSGAGKTQTLRMIAGIAAPDQARIAVAGRVLCDTGNGNGIRIKPQERHLAYMFQDYALFPHLTVRQNVAFALRRGLLNPGKDVASDTVDRWISTFGLHAIAQHYPHQISGGQRQRTALARALVSEPAALLLDEPFAALDKGLRQRLRDELKALQTELRLPMLVITHDDDDVGSLAEEVICLEAGRVVRHHHDPLDFLDTQSQGRLPHVAGRAGSA